MTTRGLVSGPAICTARGDCLTARPPRHHPAADERKRQHHVKKFNKTAVSLVLGGALLATVASIGGATAGALITGQDIKDGSIKKIDLSDKIKGDLAGTGAEGAAGPAGAAGDKGDKGEKGDKGDKGDNGLAGSFYATATYLNGGAGDATVACDPDNATRSQTFTAIAGGVRAGGVQSMGQASDFDVAGSFPGRMDWTTGQPKPDRLDGWIVLGSGGWSEKLVVWALCVPNTSIQVVNTDYDN